MMIALAMIGVYLLFVSLNFFVLQMELSIEDMSEEDFRAALFLMWCPVVNIFGLLINALMLIDQIYRIQKKKRIEEKRPSFHERLFSIQKVNGKYQKRKQENK